MDAKGKREGQACEADERERARRLERTMQIPPVDFGAVAFNWTLAEIHEDW